MTKLEQIEAEQLEARKSGDVKSKVLTTLISEIKMVGKNKRNGTTTEEETLSVIKKFVKNINETLSDKRVSLSNERLKELGDELAVYEKYLPKQLTLEELKGVVVEITKEVRESNGGELTMRDMKTVIAKLSQRHPDSYDSKSASILIRELITR